MPTTHASTRARPAVALLGAGAILLAAASPASGHGITGDAGTASPLGFVVLGIEHMLLGWDHLLFIAAVLLLAAAWRRAAKLITVFVLGHSLTLITATLAGWRVNATLVDLVIVLSVAVVAGWGLVGAPRRWDVFGMVVYAFGLVHGLGLATRFQALGVPDDGLLVRVVAFNLGIEVGQLIAIAAVLAAALGASRVVGALRSEQTRRVAFAAMLVVGATVAPVMAYEALAGTSSQAGSVALPEGSGCSVADRTRPLPAEGGGHPPRVFYGPDEVAPGADFGHALGDGYVVVLYPRDLSSDDVRALRAFVEEQSPPAVLAGADSGSPGITALTLRQVMTCPDLHVGALRVFSASWFDSLGS